MKVSITSAMDPELSPRPKWEIDRLLDGLIGKDVRVAAKSFSPGKWTGEHPDRLLPIRGLFLPENSQPSGLPVFFEGQLRGFVRQIGIVFVWLNAPTSSETAGDGVLYFRGQMAVILRGPAVVELALPFQVERLPADPDNYWRDVRLPCAQFEFPFSAGAGHADTNLLPADSPPLLKPPRRAGL